jgi:bloom syndrome protein
MSRVPRTNIHEFVARWERGELPQLQAFADLDKYEHLDEEMPDLVPPPCRSLVPLVPDLLEPGAVPRARPQAAVDPAVFSVAVFAPQQPAGPPPTGPIIGPRATLHEVTPHAANAPAIDRGSAPNCGSATTAVAPPARTLFTSPGNNAFLAAPRKSDPKSPEQGWGASPQTPDTNRSTDGHFAVPTSVPWSAPAFPGASSGGHTAAPAPAGSAVPADQVAELKSRYRALGDRLAALQRQKQETLLLDDDDAGLGTAGISDAAIAAIDAQINGVQREMQAAQLMLAAARRGVTGNGTGSPSSSVPNAAPPPSSSSFATPDPHSPWSATSTNRGGGGSGAGEAFDSFDGSASLHAPNFQRTGSLNQSASNTNVAVFNAMDPPRPRPGAFQWDGVGNGMTREQTAATTNAVVNPHAEWNHEKFAWSQPMRDIMKHTFGLHTFRPCQLPVINAAMSQRDVFVLLPTGGGKSLCYQLPAILNPQPKVTIVFSPLVSLIQDQVQQLHTAGVQAMALTAATSENDRRALFDEWRTLNIQNYLVYITPEYYGRSDHFVNQLRTLNQNQRLDRFVIDEAHCISQWGHDFRTDYRKLQYLKQYFPNVPILALTATATDAVQRDVLNTLRIPRAVLFHASFNRPNLAYFVEKVGKTCEKQVADVINRPHLKNKCGIVYCLSKKDCETMAKALRAAGISADYYHSEAEQKDVKQMQWSGDRTRVMCATIAFGMGINKPDVRFVVHASLPKSIEGYYQESGRAGRDGAKAECYLFWCGLDRMFHDRMALGKTEGNSCVYKMQEYALDNVTCRRNQQLGHFGEVEKDPICSKSVGTLKNEMCDNCASRDREKWAPSVLDVTADAVDLCKVLIHLGAMTSKQLVGAFRGTPSDCGPAVAKRLNLRGLPSGMSPNKNLSKDAAERTVLLLLIHGIMKERLEQVGQFNVVGYLEMGNAQLYQAIQRREKVISFEIRKAAARPAPLALPAEDPTSKSRRKQQVTEQAAQAIADLADEDDRELAVNALAMGRRTRKNSFSAGAKSPLKAPGAPAPAAPAKALTKIPITTLFRQPVSRQTAIEIEESQDGCIPTPADARLGTATESVIATPTELTARPPRQPALPHSVLAALKTSTGGAVSDDMVRGILQDAFSKRLDNTLKHVVDQLVEEHHTTRGNILTTNARTWLVEDSSKIAGWGSVEQFMDIDGMGLHKVATFGPAILTVYRAVRHQVLGDVSEITPDEVDYMLTCEERHRADTAALLPRRDFPHQLIDPDTPSPDSRAPTSPNTRGPTAAPAVGGGSAGRAVPPPGGPYSPGGSAPAPAAVAQAPPQPMRQPDFAPLAPVVPVGAVSLAATAPLGGSGIKKTMFRPRTAAAAAPSSRAAADGDMLPAQPSRPQPPAESRSLPTAGAISGAANATNNLDPDDRELLELCDSSQFHTPLSSRALSGRPSSSGSVLSVRDGHPGIGMPRSFVLVVPPRWNDGAAATAADPSPPQAQLEGEEMALTAAPTSMAAPAAAASNASGDDVGGGSSSYYNLASGSDDDVEVS